MLRVGGRYASVYGRESKPHQQRDLSRARVDDARVRVDERDRTCRSGGGSMSDVDCLTGRCFAGNGRSRNADGDCRARMQLDGEQ